MRYVYDGRVAVQERDANNLATVSFTRGKDLSGTRQGSGGIGGLLARTDHGSQLSAYYISDANGNITAMINTNQVIVARYTYDPYGNILSKSGPLADANLYRFSSKEHHPNSGMVYYLYRFYDPNLQRWLNQDPIGEYGGINLYGYVFNNPVNWIDLLGLAPDINCLQPNDPAGKNQNLVKDSSTGKYSVMAHGSPTDVTDKNGKSLSPQDLANKIKADKNYKPGMPVVLIACLTGKGANCFAEQLAGILKADVFAPGDFVGVSKDGSIWVGPVDPKTGYLDPKKEHKGLNFYGCPK